MADDRQIQIDAPIPGMGMTAPLGGRPWQQPPQMATVEEAMSYYIKKLEDQDFAPELLTVIELGVPLTTIANSFQLASVMEGKHSVDVGILVIPVIVEMMMAIAEANDVEYVSGMSREKERDLSNAEKLQKLISVSEEQSGLIVVSVQMEDPNLAASITNYIADYVKEFISIEQEKEAIKQKEFIYDQMLSAKSDLSDSELKLTNFFKKYPLALGNPDLQLQQGRLTREIEENQAVYITLRQQYEIAKIEAEEDKLFINILDTGDVAVRKSKPKRLLILLSSIMFGMMSSVLIILNRNKLLFKQ